MKTVLLLQSKVVVKLLHFKLMKNFFPLYSCDGFQMDLGNFEETYVTSNLRRVKGQV